MHFGLLRNRSELIVMFVCFFFLLYFRGNSGKSQPDDDDDDKKQNHHRNRTVGNGMSVNWFAHNQCIGNRLYSFPTWETQFWI